MTPFEELVRAHLPAALLRPGPAGLLLWHWLALPLLAAASWLLGRWLGWWTRGALARLSRRTAARWDDLLLERLAAPLTFAWSLAVAALLIPLLGLSPAGAALVGRGLRALSLVAIFWALWSVVDLVHRAVAASEWVSGSASARSLLGIAGSLSRAAVIVMGAIAALAQLGYPVASLLAGLGIGGLAVALAAQKTLENLFGSVSLAADEPFRVGDFVKIEDFVGTVEAIGPRSTRIRTLDRTLVTLPNGRLADMRIENFTVRDRMRLSATLGLVYSTTADQMRAVLSGVEAVLRAHPRIWPDAVVVRLAGFGDSSLDIELMAWFQTADWSEFQEMRQEVLLAILGVVEQAGTSFAYPTRTVFLAPAPAADSLVTTQRA